MMPLHLLLTLALITQRPASAAQAPAFNPQPPASVAVIDRIMAVIAGQPITLSDVNAAIAFGIVPAPPSGEADPAGYALNRLIERALVLTEVERYQPPEPDKSEIESRLAGMKERAGASFAQTLKATGVTEDGLRRYIRDDLRIQTYMNQRFGALDPGTRAQLMADWLTGLRRRSDVMVLYLGK